LGDICIRRCFQPGFKNGPGKAALVILLVICYNFYQIG
jgi:hypothetical protein